MLSYHPLTDPYHCLYRICNITSLLGKEAIELEKVSIIDFFVLFPSEIPAIRFTRDYSKLKRVLRNEPVPYEKLSNRIRVFSELKRIHDTSFNFLAAKEFIDMDFYISGNFKRTKEKLPNNFEDITSGVDFLKKYDWLEIFLQFVDQCPLKGLNGLYNRVGLGEFKYDC